MPLTFNAILKLAVLLGFGVEAGCVHLCRVAGNTV